LKTSASHMHSSPTMQKKPLVVALLGADFYDYNQDFVLEFKIIVVWVCIHLDTTLNHPWDFNTYLELRFDLLGADFYDYNQDFLLEFRIIVVWVCIHLDTTLNHPWDFNTYLELRESIWVNLAHNESPFSQAVYDHLSAIPTQALPYTPHSEAIPSVFSSTFYSSHSYLPTSPSPIDSFGHPFHSKNWEGG
jgi:hypothetical protein